MSAVIRSLRNASGNHITTRPEQPLKRRIFVPTPNGVSNGVSEQLNAVKCNDVFPDTSLDSSIAPSVSSDCGALAEEGGLMIRKMRSDDSPSLGDTLSSTTRRNRRGPFKHRIFKSNTSLDESPRAQLVSDKVPPNLSSKGYKLVQVHSLGGEPSIMIAVGKKCQVWDVFTLVMEKLAISDDRYFGLATRQPAEGINSDKPRHEYYFLEFEAPMSKYLPRPSRLSLKSVSSSEKSSRPVIALIALYMRVRIYVGAAELITCDRALHYYYLQLRENLIDHWSGSNSVSEERCWLLAATALHADSEHDSCGGGESSAKEKLGLHFQAEKYLPLWVINLQGLDYIRSSMPRVMKDFEEPNPGSQNGSGLQRLYETKFCEEASREPFSLNCHLYSLRRHRSNLMDNALFAISDRGIDMWGMSTGGGRVALKNLTWGRIAQLSFDTKQVSVGGIDGVAMVLHAQTEQKARYLLDFCRSVHKRLMMINASFGAGLSKSSNSPLVYTRNWTSARCISAELSPAQIPAYSLKATTSEIRHPASNHRSASSASTIPVTDLIEFVGNGSCQTNGFNAARYGYGKGPSSSPSPVFSARTKGALEAVAHSIALSDSTNIHQSNPGQNKPRMYHKGSKPRRATRAQSNPDSPVLGPGTHILVGTFSANAYAAPRERDEQLDGITEEMARLESREEEALQLEDALDTAPSPPRAPIPNEICPTDGAKPNSTHQLRPIIKMPPKIRPPPQYFEAIEQLNRHSQVQPQLSVSPPPTMPHGSIPAVAATSMPCNSQDDKSSGHFTYESTPCNYSQQPNFAGHAPHPAVMGTRLPVPVGGKGAATAAEPPYSVSSSQQQHITSFAPTHQPRQQQPQPMPTMLSAAGASRKEIEKPKERGKAVRLRRGAGSRSPSQRTGVKVNRVKSMPSSRNEATERAPPPRYCFNTRTPASLNGQIAAANGPQLHAAGKVCPKWPDSTQNHRQAVDSSAAQTNGLSSASNGTCEKFDFNTEELKNFPMLKALYLEAKSDGLAATFS